MELLIRAAESTDWPAVNALAAAEHNLHVRWRPDLYQSTSTMVSSSNFQDWLKEGLVFVGELNGMVVAYISASIQKIQEPALVERQVLRVEGLAVDVAYHRCGYGR